MCSCDDYDSQALVTGLASASHAQEIECCNGMAAILRGLDIRDQEFEDITQLLGGFNVHMLDVRLAMPAGMDPGVLGNCHDAYAA